MFSGEWGSILSSRWLQFFTSITPISCLLFPSSPQSCCTFIPIISLWSLFTPTTLLHLHPGTAFPGSATLGHLSSRSPPNHILPFTLIFIPITIPYLPFTILCHPSPIRLTSLLIIISFSDCTPTCRQMRNGWTTCMVLTPSLWLRIRRGPSCLPTSWIV